MRLSKITFSLALIGFLTANVMYGQNKTAVVSKVTATWCPNCGTWGWDYFEELKDIYESNSNVTLLGVHHSGDLRNNTSSWFADNLDFFYQPVFFLNNEDLDVSRNNWENKVDELADKLDIWQGGGESVNLSFQSAYVLNDEIMCSLNIDASNKSDGEYYVAIYVFENDVQNFQSSRGMSSHPNVLRDVMNDDVQGDLFTGQDANGNPVSQLDYSMPLNMAWDKDKVGLLAVVWEEDGGQYALQNASSIHNIGLLSSDFETLDGDAVKVAYLSNGFNVRTDLTGQFRLYFYNSSAQLIQDVTFTGETTIDTSNLPAGIYSIHLMQENKVYTQQVIVTR